MMSVTRLPVLALDAARNADLARSLDDGNSKHAVEAECSECNRNHGECAQQR